MPDMQKLAELEKPIAVLFTRKELVKLHAIVWKYAEIKRLDHNEDLEASDLDAKLGATIEAAGQQAK